MKTKTHKILFICLGNICRSPLAEAIFNYQLEYSGINTHGFTVDSCGTSDFHKDELPDPRTRAEAAKMGLTLTHRSRPLQPKDGEKFNWLICMDEENLERAKEILDNKYHQNLHLLTSFSEENEVKNVPDPYFGGEEGFSTTTEIIRKASKSFLNHLVKNHPL